MRLTRIALLWGILAACGGSGAGAPSGSDACAAPMTAPPIYRGHHEHAFIVGCMSVQPGQPDPTTIRDDEVGEMIEDICRFKYLCNVAGDPFSNCEFDEIQVDTGLDYHNEHHGFRIEIKHTEFSVDSLAGLPRGYRIVPEGQTVHGESIRFDGEIHETFSGPLVFEEVGVAGELHLQRFEAFPDPNGIIQGGPGAWVGFNFFVSFPQPNEWVAGSISAPCTLRTELGQRF